MARKPSPKPKHVAHTKRGQKNERKPMSKTQAAAHTPLAEMDRLRAIFESATAPYIPAMPTPEQRKVGRPTDYRPEFCDLVVEDAALGHSIGGTAALIGVARSTLMDWAASFPEFGTAVARAKTLRLRFYEGHAIDIARRGGDSTRMTAVKLGLLNFGDDDWKERLTAEHNVTFSLAGLINESMKLAPPTIEGEAVEQSNISEGGDDGAHD